METLLTTNTDYKQVITSYVREVINGKQLDRLGEFFADDCSLRNTTGRNVQGIEAFSQALQHIFTVAPDLFVTVDELILSGDNAAYRITAQGTQLHELESIQPSSPAKIFRIEEAFFIRFKDGKIKNVWILTDTHTMIRQLTAA